ncbi:damage-inducible protein DinB [Bordetella genomosp. 1]|uniref:Damage-inducible protein DinB n=1 Tax=Bordetella genomosp. 1 TaxID=1395607 RepID=A0A261SQ20_9BORD|nr:DinB family protein [Bordetella genomosp. 1]OZI38930.1 damage-inducible protein DinB [Bordetella genomosp. 1]
MPSPADLALLADYNQWMNRQLLDACARLPAAELDAERGAFFGSILGTLNHLIVGDTMWLQRFATHPGVSAAAQAALAPVRAAPPPGPLDGRPHATLTALAAARTALDGAIVAWVAALTPADLARPHDYRNSRGVASRRELGALLLHFFNHQTHHRGQATTLLTQAGADVGATDLLLRVPDALNP